jgi:Ca2+-binding RTX toxin-like protein
VVVIAAVAGISANVGSSAGTVGSGFTVTPGDLAFILKQIKIAEHHAATYTAANPCGTLVGSGPDQIPDVLTSYGLRTVDGSCNNLVPGREKFGAADPPFPRLTTQRYRQAEPHPAGFFGVSDPGGPSTSYAQKGGLVFDTRPRLISNLIVDQTSTNPAAVAAAEFPVRTQNNPGLFPCTTDPDPTADPPVAGVPAGCVPSHQTLFIPNVTTDVGLSPPYNELFTFFGQFFDHGVDQTVKSGGSVFVPLRADDPLIAGPDHKLGTADDLPANQRFMVLTRAQNQPGPDGILGTADDIQDSDNTDTPWVDQSQTYTSHSSHQVFVREYVLNASNRPVSTGKLLGGLPAGQTYLNSPDGTTGMATWAAVKKQARDVLGLLLRDKDVTNVPMIAADPYGKFIPGPARGLPQYVTKHGLVEGNLASPVPVPSDVLYFDTPFIGDIAHNADPSTQPGPDGILGTADDVTPVPDADNTPSADFAHQPAGTYDDEMLNAHFCAGDGRVNENIGLTTIHQIFHSEHDRLVDYIKNVLLNDTSGTTHLSDWQLPLAENPEGWNGERLFQAARFVTEMEYQHLVFEEFARKIQPAIRPFHVYSPDINPSIPAEFAHAVYRFGHSMLDDDVNRTVVNADGTRTDTSLTLLKAFLNPPEFFDGGNSPTPVLTPEAAAGSIVMGVSDQVGNELDEFVTETLRNNLLGLPLDLATINMTRAREAGIPPLNDVRRQIFAQTNDGQLAPYKSWSDFGQHLKHPESLINFVAAYGTHPTIRDSGPDGQLGTADDVTTAAAKRAAAKAIVDPAPQCTDPNVPNVPAGCMNNPPPVPADAADFMFSTGAWASNADGVTTTGLDDVDLWVGGLAEVTNINGGLLGTTFNYVFQNTLENLQDGDRLYYLARTPGLNLRTQLEGNSFAELIMRNTTGTQTLKADAFATADCKFELANLAGTPAGFAQFGSTVADDPASQCDESQLLTRSPDGTIKYKQFNSVDPSGINGQSVYNGTDYDAANPGPNGQVGDRIFGGLDNDTLWGGRGNDNLEGGGGDDVTLGGLGNDIITDLDGADVEKGGPGNDAIDGGTGDDLVLGGDGSDFTNGGANDNETFGGPGTDFINAGAGADAVFGDGGDDWIQGGTGQDLLQGDHGAPFFDDPGEAAPGNDVFVGQPGENDYDAEGGDDIMMQNVAIDRNAGAGGFDWAIHQNDTVCCANDDMMINNNLGGLPIQVVVNRDRWQETEADSGSPFDDIIKGTDGALATPRLVGGAGFTGCDAIDAAGLARIKGLDQILPPVSAWVGDAAAVAAISASGQCPLVGPVWGEGDILLGGAGSDTITGRAGDDVIDGDRELRVAISVRTNVDDPATEIGRTDLMEHTATSGTFGPGTAGMNLQQAVFAGLVDPGNLAIVREIVSNPNAADVDTAVYSGARASYTVTRNANGSVTVNANGGVDGVDTLWNVEQLQFSDGTIAISSAIAAPAVTTTPSSTTTLLFANTNVGATSAAQTVTVLNSGTAPLTISSLSIAGLDFAISGGTCSPATPVAAGASCTVNITFSPQAAGTRTSSLSIADNATGSPHTVPLQGTGVALAPAVSLSTSSLTFASTAIGATSAAQTVTVTNTGNANLVVSGATVGGANAGDFAATTTCGTVAPAGTCSVSVTFKPTASGARSGSVAIASNAASSPNSVSLSGTGTGPGASLSPASLTFAAQNANTTSAAQTVTLTNSGNANLVTGAAAVSITGANPGDFAVATNGCNNKTIAPGASCAVSVTFRPTAGGTRTASLSIASNVAGSPSLVPLSGTGIAPAGTISLSATSVGFGATRVGATATKSITVSNTGGSNVTIAPIATGFGAGMTGTNAADFGVQSTTCGGALAPKGKCTITFAFKPAAAGAKSATFTFTSDATGSPHSVALTGSAR